MARRCRWNDGRETVTSSSWLRARQVSRDLPVHASWLLGDTIKGTPLSLCWLTLWNVWPCKCVFTKVLLLLLIRSVCDNWTVLLYNTGIMGNSHGRQQWNVFSASHKVPEFFVRYWSNAEFLDRCQQKYPTSNFMKIPPVAADLTHAFTWKDRTKQIGPFHDCTKTCLRMSLFVSSFLSSLGKHCCCVLCAVRAEAL
jgi:hypothetical protein